MTKKKSMKKMLNVLTAKAIIVSSISGAVLTPSLTALAAEDQNVIGTASTGTQSDSLLNFNWELDSTNKLKYWLSQGATTAFTNTDVYTKVGNVYTTSDGFKTITVNSDNSFTLSSTKLSHTIAQNVATEIGKEYTISTRVQQSAMPAQDGAQLIVGDKKIVPTSKDELVSYTFVATSTSTKISFVNQKNGVGTRTITFGDIYAGKSEAQLEKDSAAINARAAVNNLFENQDPTGQIRADLTQAEIDAAQKLIFLVASAAERLPIGDDLKKAQTQLNERNAQSKAEQEAAENAVKALFNNNDVAGTIKDTTDQAAIDNAKELVVIVKDADKKAELESQIAEAQKQLDANAGEAAEQARQEAATNAVKELFNNNDVTGTIKDATDQAAIDNAKTAVEAVTNPTKKAELTAQLDEAQDRLNIRIAKIGVSQLFNNNDVTGTIKDVVTQAYIDAIQNLVNEVSNPAEKAKLQADLNKAQAQLDAKGEATEDLVRQEAASNAVKALFNNDDVTGAIKESTDQDAINKAKELVAAVTNAAKKAELEAQVTEAQKQLDAKTEAVAEQARQEAAKKAVEELFNNNDVTGTIKEDTTQDAIDKAKELVSTLTDTDKKAELEAQIAEAQKQLTDKETKVEVRGKGNTFILQQDRYLTGTYTGDVASMSVEVNGKLYYGGTVKNGEFSFYALDKIASVSDKVIINLHSADKTIQASFPVVVKEATKVTQNAFKVKDSYITGTFNNSDITKMGIVVNGKAYWGGTVADGEFKYYALDKITSATDEVVLNFYSANNELIISKNLVITAPVVTSGDITSASLAVGDKNIVGTITGDIKSFGVTIDGTTYNGGTIAADGTFKFYVSDKKFTADSVITIVGYDKAKNVLSEMNLVVSK
ncbi:toxin Cry1Ac domain D-VI-related protein [Listeria rocourtiae]|uniref:toxin Cry1Ac domain D-VI-related protein n=1 Tax=Listeria rocourtiae TaxID=647910 RepID=UPI003D2F5F54